jgi:hypothetical protein
VKVAVVDEARLEPTQWNGKKQNKTKKKKEKKENKWMIMKKEKKRTSITPTRENFRFSGWGEEKQKRWVTGCNMWDWSWSGPRLQREGRTWTRISEFSSVAFSFHFINSIIIYLMILKAEYVHPTGLGPSP